jgi:hypothetical protein
MKNMVNENISSPGFFMVRREMKKTTKYIKYAKKLGFVAIINAFVVPPPIEDSTVDIIYLV